MGMLYQRGTTWWLKYYRDGRPIRESAGKGATKTEARDLLKRREGDVARGLPLSPKVGRIRVDEALAQVVADYTTNGKRSRARLAGRIENHLVPWFAGRRMAALTTSDVRAYIADRRAAGARNATINRELAALKRAFTLAIQGGTLLARPHIPMLREDNVRTGFFEPDQFHAVRGHLPPCLRELATVAFVTGWRVPSELLPLQWRQVDLQTGTLRLDAGTTKNGEPRVFPLTSELRRALVAQRASVDTIQRERGMVIPWVFVWPDGRRIRDFRGAWATACKMAGVPGRLLHDFRRTAVRNLERAGVPRSVAMAMVGHKTESVYRRYAIVAEGDLQEAARRLDTVAQR